jgi:Na+/H+ antiporter NhaD/arsenite permease-like protein
MSVISWIALGLFLLAYVVISTDKINKTIVALCGASLFIFMGIVPHDKIFTAIDWNVIFLLVSMMVIINIVKTTGLFQFIANKAAKAVKGNPIAILVILSLITAVISAFLDNVTTVLILSPVIILIAVELGISPVPFIISMAVASNIGGTATLIGDPPNIMIGSAANLDFMAFVVNLCPVIVLILVAFSLLVVFLFRKQLQVSAQRKARIMDFDESKSLTNKPLLVKSVIVLGLVIVGFLFHSQLNVEASSVALAGAAVLLLISGKKEPDEFFRDVEWTTIIFFIGLFILVRGLVDQGWIGKASNFILAVTGGNIKLTSGLLLWVSGVLSAVVDNIPYVATMIPMIQGIAHDLAASIPGGAAAAAVAVRPLWWALSLGACLGGNATLVGASANVVSASICGKNGYPISFMTFTKYGSLITLVNLLICTAYIMLRYF